MQPMSLLITTCALFVGSHLLLSHPLRGGLAGRLGERGFMIVYSIVAIATFVLIVQAWRGMPPEPPLWAVDDPLWILASLLVLVASILFTGDSEIHALNREWRKKDRPTNVLSFPARKYKKRVFDRFAPLFKSINWQNLNQLCEARIVVQPPCKSNNYSNKTYPRYDVDNYSKPVLDCLKGKELLFSDDRIFVSEKVEFAQPYQDGRVWLSCVNLDDVDWLNREVPHQWLSGSVELV